MANDSPEILTQYIPAELDGKRLDQALASLFNVYSRSRLQQWARAGLVTVDGLTLRPRDKVHLGQQITVQVQVSQQTVDQPESMALDIVAEDSDILVINKPAGLVVHPGAGNRSGTLLNALLHHAPELAQLPRAGIVHRLDKDTSGLLVIAKTLASQKSLVEQLQSRTVHREYLAVVHGAMTSGGTIEAPIGRHPVQRTRMAVVSRGKPAVSHYRVMERFRTHTLVRVRLETGRTHQIRVHMAHIHHPLVGDPEYSGRARVPPKCSEELKNMLQQFKRQALHATQLELIHPRTQAAVSWERPAPTDMLNLIKELQKDAHAHRHG